MSGLPPVSVELMVIAAFVRVAERRMPGITEEALADLEDEALRAEVVRLRGPRMAPEVTAKFGQAAAWVNAVRLVECATQKPKPWFGLMRPPR